MQQNGGECSKSARSEHETGLEGKRRALGVGESVVKQEISGFRAIYFWLGRGGTAHPHNTLAGDLKMPHVRQVARRLAVSARRPCFPCRSARRFKVRESAS